MKMTENWLEVVVKWPFLSVANFGLQSLDIVEALYLILLHFYRGYFSTVSDRNSAHIKQAALPIMQ